MGDQTGGPAVALKLPSPRGVTHGSRFQTSVRSFSRSLPVALTAIQAILDSFKLPLQDATLTDWDPRFCVFQGELELIARTDEISLSLPVFSSLGKPYFS